VYVYAYVYIYIIVYQNVSGLWMVSFWLLTPMAI